MTICLILFFRFYLSETSSMVWREVLTKFNVFTSVLDFGNIGEGYPNPCKQVYACQNFLDFGGEARQAGQVAFDLIFFFVF